MSPFFRLPLEIRNIIYKDCLIVDYRIAPYPSTYELCKLDALGRVIKIGDPKPVSRPRFPSLSILRVNKQLHRETSRILYGQNRWKDPQCSVNSGYYASIFDLHGALFKDIEICFDWRESNFRLDYFMGNDPSDVAERVCPQYAQRSDRERQEFLHTPIKSHAFQKLERQLSQLLPYLTSLVIDITRLYCPIGCCRTQVFTRYFQDDFIKNLGKEVLRSDLQSIKFVGLQNPREKRHVYSKWGFKEDGTVDKVELARQWRLYFPVVRSGDDLDHGDYMEPAQSPCVHCFPTNASDEPSVPSPPESSFVDNANAEGADEDTADFLRRDSSNGEGSSTERLRETEDLAQTEDISMEDLAQMKDHLRKNIVPKRRIAFDRKLISASFRN